MTAWRSTLSDDEAAEYERAKAAARRGGATRRAVLRARRQARARLDRQILALVLRGWMTDEIALALAMTERGVRRCCQRIGVDLATPKRRRFASGWITAVQHEQLAKLAAERGEHVADTVAICVGRMLDDGAFRARQVARPPVVQLRAVA